MRLKNVKNASEIISKSSYVVLNPEDNKGKWNGVFKNNNPIDVEIGMGKGDFIINMAKKYPNVNFIGIEMFDSVIVRAVQKLDMKDISNLKLIRVDANEIESIFDKEINTIYLNFSDPWPKKRHAKRRLTSINYLKVYDKLFKGRPHIVQKTDNVDLFEYSLEQYKEYGYKINKISYDLHKEDIPNIITEYEERFSNMGIKIKYVDVSK